MSLLIVKTPESYLCERRYIIDLIIKSWLGFEYEHQVWHETYSQISTNDSETFNLRMPDSFFQTPEEDWLTEKSLPINPLPQLNMANHFEEIPLINYNVPIIFGGDNPEEYGEQHSWQQTQPYLWNAENYSYLGIDIFGSAFFMLTCYEEYVKHDRDQHDRFPVTASLAYQEGFLDRPIINEYLEILWWCMKQLWPRLERKMPIFKIIVSHDVDSPFAQAFRGASQLIKNCGGDLLIRKSALQALKRIKSWQSIRRGDYRKDLNYTFDRIMDISEQNNILSAFYFKTAYTNLRFDDSYSIDHPYIRQLMKDIHYRGHEIGLHPSYETYKNPKQTKAEFKKLLQVCDVEGIKQDVWGGRQHYLRWQVPTTWRNWANAGLDYDSSLSYGDHAGFRCGVCYEYQVFDLEQRKTLTVIERPLIVMEGSVLAEQYMALPPEQALRHIILLKERCRMMNGVFTMLWHNNKLLCMQDWEIYKSILVN